LGRTGSGKTTTARLLLRIHDTSAGEIRVGGAPIRQMPLEKLRQTVSMVTQEVQLFHASVRDNLTFFDRAIPDARIEREMIDLGLGAWLARMPRGLDTELQSGGAGLSAGESQLLAFGRLFLRDPRVVILDEASSRLDPVTEALIERAGPAAGRAHRHHHRPSPRHHSPRRLHHDFGGRANCRVWRARGVGARPRQPL
ncbi:MAG TPA: ABC transporter ATP-binding protein, partial [Thermoflexales bacterium]|nr:ABC transporter ATP-binding protein [Thermoflexales bacterium]